MRKYFIILIAFILVSSVTPLVSPSIPESYNGNISNDSPLDIKIKVAMFASYIPSVSACIIKNNEIVWSNGYGYYDFSELKQPDIHTIYQVASVSKTITTTALLQLYEQGLFSLDDDVNDYVPFLFRNPDYPDIPITFRMLLSHHSSLHDHDEIAAYEYFAGPYEISYIGELLDPAGEAYHPEFWGEYPPGAGGNYSNLGLTVAGYLVELLSGQPFEQYCQDHIFQPLQMKTTSFTSQQLPQDQIACSYIRFGRIYIKVPTIDYTFLDPCGGLFTSIHDLSIFTRMHMNQGIYNQVRILNKTTIQEMHTIQFPDSQPYFGLLYFGLGWLIFSEEFGKVTHGHDGDIEFSHARMRIFDENQTAVIYLFNKGFRPSIFPKIIPSLIEHQGDVMIRKFLYEHADSIK